MEKFHKTNKCQVQLILSEQYWSTYYYIDLDLEIIQIVLNLKQTNKLKFYYCYKKFLNYKIKVNKYEQNYR